jgi:hypothetical protein
MTALLTVLALVPGPAPNVAVGVGHVPDDRRAAIVRPYRPRLLRIARCESTSRWHLNTGNGFYGGLQFTARSWQWVGGRGLPHWWSRLEQMYRAVLLKRRQGWGAWPVCAWR